MHAPVLVVGGGPTGMALALALHRAGVAPVIVDAKPGTREHSQAATLWPRTLEILDLLGAVDGLAPLAVPWHAITLHVDGVAAHVDFPRNAGETHPVPYLIGQDQTERVLDRAVRAAGIALFRNTSVTDVALDEDGATVRYERDGEGGELRADWIVGCEGSHSIVREAAGIGREGARNTGVQLLQGDVRVGGSLAVESDRAYAWVSPNGEVFFVLRVAVDGRCRVLVTTVDDGATNDPSIDDLQTLARRFVPGIALSDPAWLNRYRTQHLNATRYRAGRAFVAGDAAHVWIPIGGQGMNMSIHDAIDLGWKLGGVIRGKLRPQVLDTYESERRPVAARTIRETEQEYAALMRRDAPARGRFLRSLAPYALRVPAIAERFIVHLEELDTRYAEDVLVRDAGGDGIAPGMRVPDAAVSRDGATVRLHELFEGDALVVFGWSHAQTDGDTMPSILDSLAERFGVTVYGLYDRQRSDGRFTRALLDVSGVARARYRVNGPLIPNRPPRRHPRSARNAEPPPRGRVVLGGRGLPTDRSDAVAASVRDVRLEIGRADEHD